MGGNQEELQRYANSRVEIVGTIAPASGSAGSTGYTGSTGSATGSASGTATGTGSSASGTAGTAGTSGTARPNAAPAAAPQQLTITSVRQVAGSCGGGL
jgi:hypothetical protein